MEPSHALTIGPPFSGREQRDDWASLTPPTMALLAEAEPPPRKADARDDVTESHAHDCERVGWGGVIWFWERVGGVWRWGWSGHA